MNMDEIETKINNLEIIIKESEASTKVLKGLTEKSKTQISSFEDIIKDAKNKKEILKKQIRESGYNFD